ncbi:MAG TPA: ABC transporter permease [Gaiellaceae bacterium]|nr:ABC transporter permease [Gaiellaceae bacterium]
MSVLEKTAPEAVGAAEPLRDDRITTIRPATRMPKLELRELWHYRELATTFVWRDLKVRYKQTFIGVLWVVLQPLLTTVIFTLIFGRFADFPSDDLPYPIFVLAGVLPWTYFSTSLNGASSSIAGNRALVTRVYFPRVLLPIGAIITPLVDFLVAFPVLVAMIFYFDIPVGVEALLAPLFLLLAATTALGVGLLFAVANVRYRDVPYAIPFVINIWMYLSPVIYPVNALEDRYQWLLSFNPMTAVITGLRWSLLGASRPSATVIGVGTATAIALLLAGLAAFRSAEPRFADTI